MADSCDQSGPSRAERLIELGALRMSSAREGDVHTICLFSASLTSALPIASMLSCSASRRPTRG